jgi:hypothetical protein
MKNREVTIALCGIIGGILIGTSTYATAKDAFNASTFSVTYRSLMNTQVLPRATILRHPESTSTTDATSSVSSKAVSSSSVSSSAPAALTAECAVAKEAEAAFLDSIAKNVPVTFRNDALIKDLKAAARSLTPKYCVSSSSSAAAHSAAPAVKVDNHCEQYSQKTQRWVICNAEQAGGRVYPKAD